MAKPRIVSLCPSNTELVCALGLGDCLVGIDNFSDYPVHIPRNVPRVGPDLQIDIDKVIDLKPDLTIASLSVPGMEKVVESVKNAGLAHITLAPTKIEDIFGDMRLLAKALPGSVSDAAVESSIAHLEGRVSRIQERTENITVRPRLYWEWWPKPVFSPARDNWLTEVSQLCGAENIFHREPGAQVQDDGNRVITADPDVFLAVWTGVPQDKVPIKKILIRPGWSCVKAFRENHVFVLSEGLFCRPSPRLIDGMEQLVSLLHPDIAMALQLPPVAHHAPIRTSYGEFPRV